MVVITIIAAYYEVFSLNEIVYMIRGVEIGFQSIVRKSFTKEDIEAIERIGFEMG
jgi:hypothetical protein